MTNLKFDECKKWWTPCVATALSFYNQLAPALSAGGLDSKAKVDIAFAQFSSIMNAILSSIDEQIKEFRAHSRL